MNITEILGKNSVRVDLGSTTKEEVLVELVDLLVEAGSIKKTDKSDVIKKIKEREVLGSTGIGKGVAIPHAKSAKVKKMVAAFGVSKKGLDFKSLDGEPTYLFFILIAPGETPGPHLKALAKISRLLDDKFTRERLCSCATAPEVVKIIKDEESKKKA